MDTRNGNIYEGSEIDERLSPDERRFIKPMKLPLTPIQRATRKVGRNDPCPCGSEKKFKRCCLVRQQ